MLRVFSLLCMLAYPIVSIFANAAGDDPQVTTDRYTVYSDFSQSETLRLLVRIEELHEFYNQYFSFRATPLTSQLVVRYFSSKSGFDTYLRDAIGQTYNHFVLLDYNSQRSNELVLFSGVDDFEQSLAHYSFIQFLEGQIQSPPLWLREGYALYFEDSRYDDTEQNIRFKENNRWLDALKEIVNDDDLIPLAEMLRMSYEDIRAQRAQFYPQAWGFVSFLAGYRERGNERLAAEVNESLAQNATEQENQQNALDAIEDRIRVQRLEEEFIEYIQQRMSYSEIVRTAIDNYQIQQTDDAEKGFYQSITANPRDYTPYYYLGLIHYERDDFATAEYFYIEALARGVDEGAVHYALGLNALANSEYDKAERYLNQAVSQNSELRPQVTEAFDMFPADYTLTDF